MPEEVVLAIDQGSSSTKALLLDADGSVVAGGSAPLAHSYPAAGWVEQDAAAIVASVRDAVGQCLRARPGTRVRAVGLSTQRESMVLWERATGAPVLPLVSWQDQRTAAMCQAYLDAGHGADVRRRSGLPLDPMFSATKARWLLDRADPDRTRARRGELCLGTVDSWLLFALGGAHVIEVGNASRTQLLNLATLDWDEELLALFEVPRAVLPAILPSTGPFPGLRALPGVPDGTPVTAVLGDSHAALFAQAGWASGRVKVTYGTGSSVIALSPADPDPAGGLCRTVAWSDGTPSYALEGNIRSSGATLSWLARAVGSEPGALAELAADASSDGVHLVPGFSGLGAPYWDAGAVGLLSGLTLGTGLPQLARAALESIAFQVEDVLAAVDATGTPARTVLADGGAARNSVLMQLQADISGRDVHRAAFPDVSALGAAHLAGRAAGIWSAAELEQLPRPREAFAPHESPERRSERRAGWRAAVRRARGHAVA